MFCTNCGKQLEDGSKFCTNCGASLAAEPAAPAEQANAAAQPDTAAPAPCGNTAAAPCGAPVADAAPAENAAADAEACADAAANAPASPEYTAPIPAPAPTPTPVPAPAPGGKKRRTGLFVGIGAAVLVVLAAVILLISGVFSSSSGALDKAISKSFKAYENALSSIGITDFSALSESGKVSNSLSFTIDALEGDESYSGLGFRADLNTDMNTQWLELLLTPFYDGSDIAVMQIGLNGSKLYAGSPELTGGDFYCIDTATLGDDLAALTGEDSLEGLSFNIFDLIRSFADMQGDSAATSSAAKSLSDSIEVNKAGQETISVNGAKLSATRYDVLLPENAIDSYLDALEDSMDADRMSENMEELLASIGLDDELAGDFMTGFNSGMGSASYISGIRDIMEELGDLSIQAYVSDGLLVAAVYEGEFEGTEFTITLNLGGTENYADTLSLSLSVADSGTLTLTSSGNHSGKDGLFSDTTTLTLKEKGSSRETLLSLKQEYDKKSHDYSAKLSIGDYSSISLKGSLTMDRKSFDLQLSKIRIEEYDEVLLEGSASLSIGQLKGSVTNISNASNLLTLNDDELSELLGELSENFADIIDDHDLDFLFPSYDDDYWDDDYWDDDWDDDDYYSSYWYGYDCGYEDGYDAGWYETDYDDSAYLWYDDDTSTGYIDGYYTGYNDGWYGYDRYTNYGE